MRRKKIVRIRYEDLISDDSTRLGEKPILITEPNSRQQTTQSKEKTIHREKDYEKKTTPSNLRQYGEITYQRHADLGTGPPGQDSEEKGGRRKPEREKLTKHPGRRKRNTRKLSSYKSAPPLH